jgi:hypothetical protein
LPYWQSMIAALHVVPAPGFAPQAPFNSEVTRKIDTIGWNSILIDASPADLSSILHDPIHPSAIISLLSAGVRTQRGQDPAGGQAETL